MANSAVISLNGAQFEVTLVSNFDPVSNSSTVSVQVVGLGNLITPAIIQNIISDKSMYLEGESVYFDILFNKPTTAIQTFPLTLVGAGNLPSPYQLIFTGGATLGNNILTVPKGTSGLTAIMRLTPDEIVEPTETVTLSIAGTTKSISVNDRNVVVVTSGTTLSPGQVITVPANTVYALEYPIIFGDAASIQFGQGAYLIDAKNIRSTTTISANTQASFASPLIFAEGSYLIFEGGASAVLN